ncbi:hypothetical protein A3SK_0112125 [Pseudomonas amygdali pv. tabaci str. 6605]|nr:hypothetical protein A3SK_0112125 [Pseudomonas amygdali pv. tabaci str. 6605]
MKTLGFGRFRSVSDFNSCAIRYTLIIRSFGNPAQLADSVNAQVFETADKSRQTTLQANDCVRATYGMRYLCARIKCGLWLINRFFSIEILIPASRLVSR